MQNQFQRTESILGPQSTARLKECHVIIFGCGGVGGYVIESLTRSGVGKIDIVDSDEVDITNLNRQIIATHDTVGRNKVDVFEERIKSINPNVVLRTFNGTYLSMEAYEKRTSEAPGSPNGISDSNLLTFDDFDFAGYDYIIDAIDTVSSKIDLVLQAEKSGTPIISAMGCGNRLDPSKLTCTDIFKTHTDPLAKVMRKELKSRGIKKLDVVYSTEEPIKPNFEGLSSEPPARKNAPGSSPFVPASAGLLIGSIVFKNLLKKKLK
ncbi:MAG: tRNA threonylcarbamoyladenosine dehydratase [Firmicutes bacterium]|nr:tRNA threonylcarbamoyladenosine dehydratase [Bacillota bacterium]